MSNQSFGNKRLSDGMEMHERSKKVKGREREIEIFKFKFINKR